MQFVQMQLKQELQSSMKRDVQESEGRVKQLN